MDFTLNIFGKYQVKKSEKFFETDEKKLSKKNMQKFSKSAGVFMDLTLNIFGKYQVKKKLENFLKRVRKKFQK